MAHFLDYPKSHDGYEEWLSYTLQILLGAAAAAGAALRYAAAVAARLWHRRPPSLLKKRHAPHPAAARWLSAWQEIETIKALNMCRPTRQHSLLSFSKRFQR